MKKSRILKALALGAESMSEEIADVVADPEGSEGGVDLDEAVAVPEVIEEPELIDQATEEVAEAEAEVAADEEVVEQLDEAAATLESIYDSLQDIREEGLTPQAARFATLAVESVTKNLGIDDPVMPSLESFQGHSRRVEATTLSVEKLGQKIAEIWAAIMKFLVRIKDSVMNFLRAHLTRLGRVKARAAKLEAVAKAAKGKPKKESVDVTELAPQIVVGDKLPNYLVDSLKKVEEVLKGTQTYGKKALEQAQNYRTGLAEAAAAGNTEGLFKYPKSAAFVAPPVFKKKVDEKNGTIWKTEVLPGNVSFYVGHRASVAANLTLNTAVSGKIAEKAQPFGDILEVDVDISTIRMVIAQVKATLAAAETATKAAEAEVAKTKEQFKAVKIGSETEDKVSPTEQMQLRLAMRAYKNAESEVGKAVSRVASYAVTLCNAYLSMSQKQLAQFPKAGSK